MATLPLLMPLLVLSLASLCAHCVPVVQYGDMVQEVEPSHAHPHQHSHALRPAPQKVIMTYDISSQSHLYLDIIQLIAKTF